MAFKLVFVSTKLPTQSDVRLVLTENSTPLPSGDMTTTFGAFVVMTTSITVEKITIIDKQDNPSPSKQFVRVAVH